MMKVRHSWPEPRDFRGRPAILFFGSFPRVGGITTHLLNLSGLLAAQGASVTIASLTNEVATSAAPILSGGEIRLVTPSLCGVSSHRLRELCAFLTWRFRLESSFDLACGIGPGGFFRLMKRFTRKDGYFIYNEVTEGVSRATGLGSAHARMLRTVDGVICMSPSIASRVKSKYGIEVPVRHLPHLTDLALVRAEIRPNRFDETVRVVFLGRLDHSKNLDLLLDAWPPDGCGRCALSIYGDGPLRPHIEARAHLGNCGGTVRVMGGYSQAQISAILRDADLLVLTSRTEGLPLVLLEGLSHGIPFVATAVGGINDLAAELPYARVCEQTVASVRDSLSAAIRDVRAGVIPSAALQDHFRHLYSYEALAPRWIEAFLRPHIYWSTAVREAQLRTN